MAIFPQGLVDYYVADPAINALSQIQLEFAEDPGAQMGAGTIQWIELFPGYGFTIHLNTVCQTETTFEYTDVAAIGGAGDAYWNRTGTTIRQHYLGDNFALKDALGFDHFTVNSTTGDTVSTGDISLQNAIINVDASVGGNLSVTGHSELGTYEYLTPSAIPGTPTDGQIYYSSADHKFYFRQFGTWKDLGLGDLWTTFGGGLAPITLGYNLFLRDGAGATTVGLYAGDGYLTLAGWVALAPRTAPVVPADGQMYYDSGSNAFRFRENGAWVTLEADLWERVAGSLHPQVAGNNVNIDTNAYYYFNTPKTVFARSTGSDLVLKDTYLLSPFALSETGTTGLDTFYTGHAASIVKAFNYLAENIEYLMPSAPLSFNGIDLDFTTSTFYQGYGSGGAGNNYFPPPHVPSHIAGDYFDSIIETGTQTPRTPNTTRFDYADKGSLRLYVNDVWTDTYDLTTWFLEAERANPTGQTYPSDPLKATSALGYIIIEEVIMYNNWPPYQKGRARLSIPVTLLQQGENQIYLVHFCASDPVLNEISNVKTIFYDTNLGNRPISNVPTVVETALISSKWLSGVRYYCTNDTLTIGASLVGAFNNSYVALPMYLALAPLAITSTGIAWNGAGVTGPHTPPQITDSMVYSRVHTITIANTYATNARMSCMGSDPFGPGPIVWSVSENRLINTYPTVSTATAEYFLDEDRRLPYYVTQGVPASGVNDFNVVPVGVTGAWNSTTHVNTGGAKEAQCYNEGLVFPSINFIGSLPAQTANYLGEVGSHYYVRAMVTNGNPSNSGTLQLVGWVLSDINTTGTPKAMVEIKIPGVTPVGTWWDLGRLYGDNTVPTRPGCRTSASVATFGYSTGLESTAGVNMVIVRVTLLSGSTPKLSQMFHTFTYA